MTNETIKALLMIALFGLLETLLHLPEIRALGARLLRAMPLLPPAKKADYALRPIPIRRRFPRH